MNVTLVMPGDYPNGLSDFRLTARELRRRGIHTTIICRTDSSATAPHPHDPDRVIVNASGVQFTLQAARELRRIRPDLVHVYAYRGSAPLPLLAPGPRYLMDVRTGNVTGKPWAKLADRTTRLESLTYHAVAVVSAGVAHHVGGHGWTPDFVFPVPFSDAAMTRARAARQASPNAPIRIGYAGSLEPQRCPERIVEIANELRRRAVSCRWIILGDGRARPGVERLARAAGLHHLMDFRGKVSSDSMWQHYAEMDVALAYVPDRPHYDNQPPLKTVEAMAAGLPTVASDTRGNRDIVGTSREVMLAPDDAGALAAALEMLARDASLRSTMAERAVTASRPYAIERIVEERVIPAYQQLLRSSSTQRARWNASA